MVIIITLDYSVSWSICQTECTAVYVYIGLRGDSAFLWCIMISIQNNYIHLITIVIALTFCTGDFRGGYEAIPYTNTEATT